MLVGCLLYAFVPLDRDNVTLWLCLIGVIVMVMLFECRARYLYGNVPIFILAAAIGFRDAAARLHRRHVS